MSTIEQILANGKRPPLTKQEIKQQKLAEVSSTQAYDKAVAAYETCRMVWIKIRTKLDHRYQYRPQANVKMVGLCEWLQANLPDEDWTAYGRLVAQDWKGSQPPFPSQLQSDIFKQRFMDMVKARKLPPVVSIVRQDLRELQEELNFLLRQGMDHVSAMANILTCPGLRYQPLTYLIFAHHITGKVSEAVIDQFWDAGMAEYILCPDQYDQAWGLLMPEKIKIAGRSQPDVDQ